jgi:hypothetical protein
MSFWVILTCFQLIKISNNGILGFKKDLINCQNPSVLFSQLIQTFINVILCYLKILINCQNLSVLFWQLIESSNNGILGFKKDLINWLIFRRLIEKFDQVKMSSEIWSSDRFPIILLLCLRLDYYLLLLESRNVLLRVFCLIFNLWHPTWIIPQMSFFIVFWSERSNKVIP